MATPDPNLDLLVAGDLAITEFTTLSADASLGDARRDLLAQEHASLIAPVLVIVDAEGNYVGFLTARLLFKSLLSLWMPSRTVRESSDSWEHELLEVVRERSDVRIRDALISGLPTVERDTRLHRLIEIGCDERIEWIPVVESRRPIGLVPISAVFAATAALALRPDDEGIRMDGKAFK